MATLYTAGFDVSELALGTITLRTSGKPDISVTMSDLEAYDINSELSSKFFHVWAPVVSDLKINSDPISYTNVLTDWPKYTFGTVLEAALESAATTATWASPSSISVVFGADGYYDISYDSAFTIEFSTQLGAAILGFQAITETGSATSHASDAVPWFVILPTLSAVSDPTLEYEPDNIASHVVPDDASEGFGITRQESPRYQDWIQQFEPKELVEPASAEDTAPWTYRHLFEHCRTIWPFIIAWGLPIRYFGVYPVVLEIRYFRSEGAKFAPERATPGNDAQFHIPFLTHATGFRVISE